MKSNRKSALRRRSRASPGVRRAEILGAAQNCFAKRGYHRTAVDEIAEHAGLSKGALYWHFAGKHELFVALLDRRLEELEGMVAAAPDGAAGVTWILASLRVRRTEPANRLALGCEFRAHASRDASVRRRFELLYTRLLGALEERVQQEIDAGRFAPVNAAEVAASLLACLEGLLIQKMVQPGLDMDAVWATTESLWLRALSAG